MVRPLYLNGPSSTQALSIETIKMHEVMERSLEKVIFQGMRDTDKKYIVGVPHGCQLLSISSESGGNLMFSNIEKTADGSGCTVAFLKKHGGEDRD